MIETTEILDVAVGQVPGEVPSLVQACPDPELLAKGVRDEPLGGQLWAAQVPTG
jgi:hypothetical protein